MSPTSGNPKRRALQAIIDGVRPLVPSETRLRADVPPIFGNAGRDQHDDGTDAAARRWKAAVMALEFE